MSVFARADHTFLRNLLFVTALALFGGATTVAAGTPELAPQTKIRLTIVQWMPTKGEYRQWALGGEFVVSDSGAISLPVIGTVVVGNLDKTRLAAEIAKRLQTKIGLVEAPEATIEIVEYPPVYVVGNVAKPGEYRFRPGLTVLQALAMSGGEFRRTSSDASGAEIALIGELRVIDAALLRSNAKIARLEAEISGAKEVRFARPLNVDSTLAAEVENQERIIFATRANVLVRQSKSFSELRELLDQEIRVLEEKVDGAEASIKSAERELKGVRKLVEGGLAVASRQSDLERELAGYRANRLDYLTAIMRARQNISEATRNLEGLSDNRQAETATAIQSEQASLEQLKLKRATTEKLLFDRLSADGNSAQHGNDASAIFIIARQKDGKATEFSASEMTTLMPGDVIRVVRSVRQDLAVSQAPQSPSPSADSQSGRASQ